MNDALRLMDAGGFVYGDESVLIRKEPEWGPWNRKAHDLLLIGTRGNVPPIPRDIGQSSIIGFEAATDGAIPLALAQHIAAWHPAVRKIELFGCARQRGWDLAIDGLAAA
jgi:hypothetical protein